jgi:hypothetical protein
MVIEKFEFVEHGFDGVAEKLPIQDSTWMDHIDRRKVQTMCKRYFMKV